MRISTRFALVILCIMTFLGMRTVALAAQNELMSVDIDGNASDDVVDNATVSISSNGRFVAFESSAANIVSTVTDCTQIYVRDVQSGRTEIVSVSSDGTAGSGNSYSPSISGDGRFVAFASNAFDLTPMAWPGQIYVHDRQTGQTDVISATPDGTCGYSFSYSPIISADGRFVAYITDASNLVHGDLDDPLMCVCVYDRQARQTEVIARGVQCSAPALSTDGRYVAFTSCGTRGICVYDRQTGQTDDVGLTSYDGRRIFVSERPSISGDGRYVAYESCISSLHPNVEPNLYQILLSDRLTGRIEPISVANDGAWGNSNCLLASISNDGRFVTFLSDSTNLVAGAGGAMDNLGNHGIFLHDRQNGTMETLAVGHDGIKSNGVSSAACISADGQYLAFWSTATNLIPEYNSARSGFFRRNIAPDIAGVSIEITKPAVDPTYIAFGKSIVINGKASASAGLASVSWSTDRGESGICTGTTSWNTKGVVLHKGKNLITVTAKDRSGIEQTAQRIVIYADTTPPTLKLTRPTSDSTYLTASTSLDIGGTASDDMGPVVSLTWSNNRGGNGSCSEFSYWSVYGIALKPGLNVITVTATDVSGNKSKVTLRVTCADNVPPVMHITDPETSGTTPTTDTHLDVRGIISDNGTISHISWSSDRGTSGVGYPTRSDDDGSVQWFSRVIIRPGLNHLTFTAVDAFGNRGKTSLIVRCADNDSPVVKITAPTTEPTYATSNQTLEIIGTISDNCPITHATWTNDRGSSGYIYAHGEPYFSDTVPLCPGENIVTVTAIDALGNRGRAVLKVNYTSSSIDPEVTIKSPTTGPIYHTTDPSISIIGSIKTTRGISTITWSDDRGGSGKSPGKGTKVWRFDSIPLQIGQNTITVTATDRGGFKGKAVINVFRSSKTNSLDLVSEASYGGVGNGDSGAYTLGMSAHGRYVLFESDANNLIDGGTFYPQVYMFDRATREMKVVSRAYDGTLANSICFGPVMTPDGRYVAFLSDATNLVADGTNDQTHVFVRDMETGRTELIAVASGNPLFAWIDYNNSPNLAISEDGQIVAFGSDSSDLVASDTNGAPDVFVHDRRTGTTELVSVENNGCQMNATSGFSSIDMSADGRYVTFTSTDSSYRSGNIDSPMSVFVRDRQKGTTARISAYDNNHHYSNLGINRDGRYVTFTSRDISETAPWSPGKVHVHDCLIGKTEEINFRRDGTQIAGSVESVRSSVNGRFMDILYSSDDLVTGFGSDAQVFRHDRQSGDNEPVSYGVDNLPADGGCGSSGMSADGRFIAFSSDADNLLPVAYNGMYNVFVRDLGYGEPCGYPAVNISLPSFTSTSSIIDLSGTIANDLDIAKASYSNDRGGSGTCVGGKSWTATGVRLQSGQNTITITATDTSGNTGKAIVTVTYSDVKAPVVKITAPASASAKTAGKHTSALSGSVWDDVGVTGMTWSNTVGESGTCTFTGTTWRSNRLNLHDGVNTITVTATDAAGNKGSASILITQ